MRKRNLLKIQKQAEEWAKKAGEILQEYQNKVKIKKRKSDFGDLVTEADLLSEGIVASNGKIHEKLLEFLS